MSDATLSSAASENSADRNPRVASAPVKAHSPIRWAAFLASLRKDLRLVLPLIYLILFLALIALLAAPWVVPGGMNTDWGQGYQQLVTMIVWVGTFFFALACPTLLVSHEIEIGTAVWLIGLPGSRRLHILSKWCVTILPVALACVAIAIMTILFGDWSTEKNQLGNLFAIMGPMLLATVINGLGFHLAFRIRNPIAVVGLTLIGLFGGTFVVVEVFRYFVELTGVRGTTVLLLGALGIVVLLASLWAASRGWYRLAGQRGHPQTLRSFLRIQDSLGRGVIDVSRPIGDVRPSSSTVALLRQTIRMNAVLWVVVLTVVVAFFIAMTSLVGLPGFFADLFGLAAAGVGGTWLGASSLYRDSEQANYRFFADRGISRGKVLAVRVLTSLVVAAITAGIITFAHSHITTRATAFPSRTYFDGGMGQLAATIFGFTFAGFAAGLFSILSFRRHSLGLAAAPLLGILWLYLLAFYFSLHPTQMVSIGFLLPIAMLSVWRFRRWFFDGDRSPAYYQRLVLHFLLVPLILIVGCLTQRFIHAESRAILVPGRPTPMARSQYFPSNFLPLPIDRQQLDALESLRTDAAMSQSEWLEQWKAWRGLQIPLKIDADTWPAELRTLKVAVPLSAPERVDAPEGILEGLGVLADVCAAARRSIVAETLEPSVIIKCERVERAIAASLSDFLQEFPEAKASVQSWLGEHLDASLRRQSRDAAIRQIWIDQGVSGDGADAPYRAPQFRWYILSKDGARGYRADEILQSQMAVAGFQLLEALSGEPRPLTEQADQQAAMRDKQLCDRAFGNILLETFPEGLDQVAALGFRDVLRMQATDHAIDQVLDAAQSDAVAAENQT
ncbi:MAG: hypothetical protein AAF958_15820 [Planctomycetota bacterium]